MALNSQSKKGDNMDKAKRIIRKHKPLMYIALYLLASYMIPGRALDILTKGIIVIICRNELISIKTKELLDRIV